MCAGHPVGLGFIVISHWSCRRPGVWKRELRAGSLQIREEELQEHGNGSGTESRYLN